MRSDSTAAKSSAASIRMQSALALCIDYDALLRHDPGLCLRALHPCAQAPIFGRLFEGQCRLRLIPVFLVVCLRSLECANDTFRILTWDTWLGH